MAKTQEALGTETVKFFPFPGGYVVIMMEGRYRRNTQSGPSALECGRLELWVIGLLADAIFSWSWNTEADR
jgi:hypothetical protein